MDFPLVKDLGLGLSAMFCGIVAIINGKDKVNKTDCGVLHTDITKRLSNGDVAFAHIEEQLKPIPALQKSSNRQERMLIEIATKMKIEIPKED